MLRKLALSAMKELSKQSDRLKSISICLRNLPGIRDGRVGSLGIVWHPRLGTEKI